MTSHENDLYNKCILKIIFVIYTRCQQIDVFQSKVNSSVREIYILRPNRDQLQKMQLQGLLGLLSVDEDRRISGAIYLFNDALKPEIFSQQKFCKAVPVVDDYFIYIVLQSATSHV